MKEDIKRLNEMGRDELLYTIENVVLSKLEKRDQIASQITAEKKEKDDCKYKIYDLERQKKTCNYDNLHDDLKKKYVPELKAQQTYSAKHDSIIDFYEDMSISHKILTCLVALLIFPLIISILFAMSHNAFDFERFFDGSIIEILGNFLESFGALFIMCIIVEICIKNGIIEWISECEFNFKIFILFFIAILVFCMIYDLVGGRSILFALEAILSYILSKIIVFVVLYLVYIKKDNKRIKKINMDNKQIYEKDVAEVNKKEQEWQENKEEIIKKEIEKNEKYNKNIEEEIKEHNNKLEIFDKNCSNLSIEISEIAKYFEDIGLHEKYQDVDIARKCIAYIQEGLCDNMKECLKYYNDEKDKELQKSQFEIQNSKISNINKLAKEAAALAMSAETAANNAQYIASSAEAKASSATQIANAAKSTANSAQKLGEAAKEINMENAKRSSEYDYGKKLQDYNEKYRR